jgi:hypothetical protein
MSKEPYLPPLNRDEWWIDLMERDMDDSLREDVTLLLTNSRGDRARMEELKSLRELIKDSDEVPLPEDGTVYEDLHDRIMAAVDGKRPRKSARSLPRVSPRQLGFPTVFGTSTLMFLLAGLAWLALSKQNPSPLADADVRLMTSVAAATVVPDEVLAPTDVNEFFADAASRKLAQMGDSEAKALLERLRD